MSPHLERSLQILLLLWIGAGPAAADESADGTGASHTVDTSRWVCALCPYRYGWTGEIDLGAWWVSDSSNKFGDYRGLEEKGGFVALDGRAHFRGESGRFFDLQARDLGIDSRNIKARAGERGRFTFSLGYREIPKYRGFGTQSPYRGVGSGTLTLPSGWQPATTTADMTGLADSLQAVQLKTSRKIFDAGLSWRLGRRWSWEVDYQHQSKNGTRPFGAGVFTINSSHFPAPVDFSIDRLSAGLNFKGDRSHWRLGFTGSEFSNAQQSVTWQNPFTPIQGTEVLRASLEPDNSAYQFDVAGAWAPNSRLRLSGSAAVGRLEQDDVLLPYTINPEFGDLPLPRLTADTRIDVGTVDLSGRLTARLTRRIDLTARIERDKRDNKTPVDIWTPVITDFFEREARPNRPYSFERNRASLSLRYRPGSSVRLQAGAKKEDYERSLQSVLETEEVGWFAEAGFSPGSRVELRARLEQSDRDGQPYLAVPDFALPEHPLMRKFSLADRDRQRVRFDLDYFPTASLVVNLAYRQGEDDYKRSILGLRESNDRNLSLDLSWSPQEALTAYAFVSRDDIDSTLAGANEEESGTPWVATTDDRFLTFGLGVTARVWPGVELGLELVESAADGDIRTDSGSAEAPFPTLETDLFNARLRIDYSVGNRWGIKLLIEHERYDSTDWALDGLGPDGIPAILTFGAESPDYEITVIRAQASYQF